MKRFGLGVFVLAFAVLFAVSAFAGNLVSNPGFESGFSGWSYIKTYYQDSLGVVYNPASAHSGRGFLKVVSTASKSNEWDLQASTVVNLQDDESYAVELWVWASAAGNIIIGTHKNGNADEFRGLYQKVKLVSGWNRIEIDFIATLNTPAMETKLFVDMGLYKGILYFDDVWVAQFGEEPSTKFNITVKLKGVCNGKSFKLTPKTGSATTYYVYGTTLCQKTITLNPGEYMVTATGFSKPNFYGLMLNGPGASQTIEFSQ